MSKLIIGEGKEPKPGTTLKDYVGHVVTVDGIVWLAAYRIGDAVVAFPIGNWNQTRHFYKDTKPDLDHGPLTLATDEAVCRLPVTYEHDKDDGWFVDLGDRRVAFGLNNRFQACSIKEEIEKALSNSPTVADVRAEAIEDASDCLSRYAEAIISNIQREDLLRAIGYMRTHFNLPASKGEGKPAPPANHADATPDKDGWHGLDPSYPRGGFIPSPAPPDDGVTVEEKAKVFDMLVDAVFGKLAAARKERG